jgi:hypothetical protein
MTPEQQRIAIAKVCGWDVVGCGMRCPDYLNDLNALADARNATINTRALRIKWSNTLRAVVGATCAKNKAGHALVSDVDILFAEAPQLREALVKTLNLWTPSSN